MTPFGFTRKPLYSPEDIHMYCLDIQAMEELCRRSTGRTHMQYETILHTMREALVRMLEKI